MKLLLYHNKSSKPFPIFSQHCCLNQSTCYTENAGSKTAKYFELLEYVKIVIRIEIKEETSINEIFKTGLDKVIFHTLEIYLVEASRNLVSIWAITTKEQLKLRTLFKYVLQK